MIVYYHSHSMTDQSKSTELAVWRLYLKPDLNEMVEVSQLLVEEYRGRSEAFTDFSFMVFPAAKAFEGFLKQYFMDLEILPHKVLTSKKFRIGRSLNPDLPQRLRDKYWLYDDVVRACTPEIARQLWETWLECRNQVFHYFPNEPKQLSYSEAEAKIDQIFEVVSQAVSCKIDYLPKAGE